MGKVMSMLSRKVQRFNVENRAHKAISKDKPTPAPRHKQSAKQLEMMKEADTDFLEKHNTKDSKLDDRLKDVYLVSHATEMMDKLNPPNPDRPLPKRRTTSDDLEYGVYEPIDIRKGKCTLRQAVQFITDHNTEPAKHTAADIAAELKLDPETTMNILKYFKTFKLYIPEPKTDEIKKRPPLPWEKKEAKQLE